MIKKVLILVTVLALTSAVSCNPAITNTESECDYNKNYDWLSAKCKELWGEGGDGCIDKEATLYEVRGTKYKKGDTGIEICTDYVIKRYNTITRGYMPQSFEIGNVNENGLFEVYKPYQ